jgi:hypothetical protein
MTCPVCSNKMEYEDAPVASERFMEIKMSQVEG